MNTQPSMWERRFPALYARVSRWAQHHKENAAERVVEQYFEAGMRFARSNDDLPEALRNWGFWERQYVSLGYRLLSFQDFDRIKTHERSSNNAAGVLKNSLLRQRRFVGEKVVFHSLPFFRTYMRSATLRISRPA